MSLKCFHKGPIDKKSALVQVMAWRRTGAKPIPKPMLTQLTEVYMRHWGVGGGGVSESCLVYRPMADFLDCDYDNHRHYTRHYTYNPMMMLIIMVFFTLKSGQTTS